MPESEGLPFQIASAPIETIGFHSVEAFCALQREEGIDLDYKADWPSDLDKALCSFANTQGGILLIGVEEEEKSRKPKLPLAGVLGDKDTLRGKVLNIAFDAVYPPIMPEVAVCAFPNGPGRNVVLIRVLPSRLMHAVDHRSRVYIRAADSSRGYELAALDDLEWLWNQRAKSDELRRALLATAAARANSPKLPFAGAQESNAWASEPMLLVTIAPSFPTPSLSIEPRTLLDKVNSLPQIRSSWKLVDRRVPWQIGLWRSVPGAVCLSQRGYGSSLQFMEFGQLGHFYAAFTLEARDLAPDTNSSHPKAKCFAGYVLLSYLDVTLRYASRFYREIGYPWPVLLKATLDRAHKAVLFYQAPASMDPFNLDWLSETCPDEQVSLFETEMSARDIEIAVPDLGVKAAASVVWGYGLGWDLAKAEQWYKRLNS